MLRVNAQPVVRPIKKILAQFDAVADAGYPMNLEVALELIPMSDETSADRDVLPTKSSDSETASSDFSVLTDTMLLEAVASGSREALAILFQRHGRTVFHVAFRILKNQSEADDLRQEVFLYVFEKARLFDSEKGGALSWIVQITYARAIDKRRYLARRSHEEIGVLDDGGSHVGANGSMVEEIDARAILSGARAELTKDQHQTLELHFFEGYSLREIAAKRGQSVGNIRNHYYRALERIRIHLFAKNRR